MDFSYSYPSGVGGAEELVKEISSIFIIAGIIGILLAAFSVVCLWRIYAKAGEKGWAAIVPLYNMFVLFKITWGNGWKFLLMLIPIANFVIAVITMVKLANVFGKDGGFACGLIFLSIVFYAILAFNKSIQYVGVEGTNNTYYTPNANYGRNDYGSTYQQDDYQDTGRQDIYQQDIYRQTGYQDPAYQQRNYQEPTQNDFARNAQNDFPRGTQQTPIQTEAQFNSPSMQPFPPVSQSGRANYMATPQTNQVDYQRGSQTGDIPDYVFQNTFSSQKAEPKQHADEPTRVFTPVSQKHTADSSRPDLSSISINMPIQDFLKEAEAMYASRQPAAETAPVQDAASAEPTYGAAPVSQAEVETEPKPEGKSRRSSSALAWMTEEPGASNPSVPPIEMPKPAPIPAPPVPAPAPEVEPSKPESAAKTFSEPVDETIHEKIDVTLADMQSNARPVPVESMNPTVVPNEPEKVPESQAAVDHIQGSNVEYVYESAEDDAVSMPGPELAYEPKSESAPEPIPEPIPEPAAPAAPSVNPTQTYTRRFCANCGAPLSPPTAKFCSSCGSPVV